MEYFVVRTGQLAHDKGQARLGKQFLGGFEGQWGANKRLLRGVGKVVVSCAGCFPSTCVKWEVYRGAWQARATVKPPVQQEKSENQ